MGVYNRESEQCREQRDAVRLRLASKGRHRTAEQDALSRSANAARSLEETRMPTPNRRLRQARELRGWSQAKVAEQIGTDATTVSRWERGLFSPTPYFREKLCQLFGKNAEELGLLDSGKEQSGEGE